MTAAQRSKGKRGELEAADTLRALLADPDIARALEQPRDGGCDLTGPSLRHFHLEVKRVAAPQLKTYLDKAFAINSGIPVVMWRPDRGGWSYYLRLTPDLLAQYIQFINLVRDGRYL